MDKILDKALCTKKNVMLCDFLLLTFFLCYRSYTCRLYFIWLRTLTGVGERVVVMYAFVRSSYDL